MHNAIDIVFIPDLSVREGRIPELLSSGVQGLDVVVLVGVRKIDELQVEVPVRGDLSQLALVARPRDDDSLAQLYACQWRSGLARDLLRGRLAIRHVARGGDLSILGGFLFVVDGLLGVEGGQGRVGGVHPEDDGAFPFQREGLHCTIGRNFNGLVYSTFNLEEEFGGEWEERYWGPLLDLAHLSALALSSSFPFALGQHITSSNLNVRQG
mmetsp:Transcript_4286/g.10135  ORF Transcript_4286/g.10135 Transcript_4286/m.10135 type:complete len:211 (+) Transcript_4286:1175-1807(+)